MENAVYIALLSLTLTVGVLLIVRVRLRMLKRDYFTTSKKEGLEALKKDKKKLFTVILGNIIGWGLIISGVMMWVLPGPGWAAIIAGLTLADFPGEKRFERCIAKRKKLFNGINFIRCRAWLWWKGDDLEPFKRPE